MIKETLTLIILFTSFPVGYLLAYLCRDELVSLRKWFKLIYISCIVLAFVFLLLIDVEEKFVIVFSLVYFGVVSLICSKLSYKKGFVK